MAFRKTLPGMLPKASATEEGIQNLIPDGTLAGAATNGTKGILSLGADNTPINDRTLAVTSAGVQSIMARGAYGTCTASENTFLKTVTLPNFILTVGASIIVKFSYGNTASMPVLKVNDTGNYHIRFNNKDFTGAEKYIIANGIYEFVFDGSYWNLLNPSISGFDAATMYGTCDTAVATPAKVITIPNYTKTVGTLVGIVFTNGNTATAPTLNINGTGASPVRSLNNTFDVSHITDGRIHLFQFDGVYYKLLNPNIRNEGISIYDNNKKYKIDDLCQINGIFYRCLIDNGPNTVAGIQNPIDEIIDIKPSERQAGKDWTVGTLPIQFLATGYGYNIDNVLTSNSGVKVILVPPNCLYSTDNAETWNISPLPPATYSGLIAKCVTQTGRIVAIDNGSTTCIYSDNSGKTWSQVTLPVSSAWRGIIVMNSGRLVAFGISSTNIIYSDTNGASWTRVTSPVSLTGIAPVKLGSGRIVLLNGSTADCVYSDNGSTWTKATTPIKPVGSWRQIITNTGRIIAVEYGGTNCIYSDDAVSWTQVTLPIPTTTAVQFMLLTNTGRIFIPLSNGNALYSDNNGVSWEKLTIPTISIGLTTPMILRSGRIILYSQNNNICMYSDNNGISWTQTTLPIDRATYQAFVTSTDRAVIFNAGTTESSTFAYSDSFEDIEWNPYWERIDTTPIGFSIFASGSHTPSRHSVRFDGQLLSRIDYPELWKKIERFYNPVNDINWMEFNYSKGNETSTFRIPKKRYSFNSANEFLKIL